MDVLGIGDNSYKQSCIWINFIMVHRQYLPMIKNSGLIDVCLIRTETHFVIHCLCSLGIVMDVSRVDSSILRMQVMVLFFNYPHLYSSLKKSRIFIKMDRNQEKEQSLEKLLQSDLYPPIQYSKDMKSTFVVGGKGRLTSTTYSISSESLRKWFLKNQIESSYPVL